jgi:transposase
VARAAPPGLDAKKKTVAASERNEAERTAWRTVMQARDATQFIFLDEAGTHLALSPRYAWAPRGQRAQGQVPRNWGKNTTLLAGLSLRGVQAPWTIEGAIDGPAFTAYIEQGLCPTLEPGDVVIIDNLSVHKAARIRTLIEACGAELIYLPPYSPDLNPIEEAFSKLKAILRQLAARTREALLDAIALALDAITPSDALGWFTHAGYRSLSHVS